MERLPREIWDGIFLFLDSVSLKNVRQTNSIFQDSAARMLFKKIYFASLKSSIRNLNHICNHPELRYHVQTIVFTVNLINRACTIFEYWVYAVEEDRHRSLPVDTEDPSFYERLRELRLEEDELISTDQDYHALCLAVKQCPNLRSFETYEHFEYASCDYDDAESNPLPIVSRIRHETSLYFPFYHRRGNLDLGDQSYLYPLITRPIVRLAKAMGSVDASCHIQELDIDGIPWCRQRNGLKICSRKQQQMSTRGFRHISTAKFRFITGGLQRNTVARPLLRQTVEFFQAFAEVQSLHLDVHQPSNGTVENAGDWMSAAADLSQSLADVTWPKLVSLKLGRCGFTATAFIDFMKRHSPRLASLEATLLVLKGGEASWRHAFETIAPVVMLQSVRLEQLLDREIKAELEKGEELNEQGVLGNDELNGNESSEDVATESEPDKPDNITAREAWEFYDHRVSQYLARGGSPHFPMWGEKVKTASDDCYD